MTVNAMQVLAADDEELNLEVLCHVLNREGYHVVPTKDGEEAWNYLQAHPTEVDIILLDKMMPKMNGIELLGNIKKHPQLKHIPVIMQTASVAPKAVVEGIQAGAYYYLTKPFEEEMLVAIIHAAANEIQANEDLRDEAKYSHHVKDLLETAEFSIQNLIDARNLSAYLASYFPHPQKAIHGLSALMTNAIEHGNLQIGYNEKTRLVTEGTWEHEIKKRLASKEYRDKRVHISVERDEEQVNVVITDEGEGFRWSDYMDFDPTRMTDPNGRGIAKANIMGFTSIRFNEKGNEVTCTVKFAEDEEDTEEGMEQSTQTA